ncbi:MAG TPA: hypothetical protein VJ951_10435, partial [Bacteroidales bacterium]|nr:hypothetical protein [Bacteroidales bacterium]
MSLRSLLAVSPVDGRYRPKIKDLESYFSEYALIKYRIHVEIEYFISLVKVGVPQLEKFPGDKVDTIREIYKSFTPEDGLRVKEIEGVTNHDVKAVEYYIKEKFE